jgi:hypothetical protein
MNISNIQKKRFLDNLYKKYYSNGSIPTRQEILKDFNNYFSVNQAGFPIKVEYDSLRLSSKTDVDLLNRIMAYSLYNVDILYDSVFENNEQLMSVITSLNKRLQNLKATRAELESKVDELLFANSNTDGFFYSYAEQFINTQNIDLELSSAYVNTEKKHVSLSSVNSSNYNTLTVDNIVSNSPTIILRENGVIVNESVSSVGFENIFDGLTDTHWSTDHHASAINYVTLSINIPISSNLVISKIEGKISTTSPVSIFVRANYSDTNKPSEFKEFNSRKDFETFSLTVPASSYSSIDLVLFKSEPDLVVPNSSSPYLYKFGIRDLIIGSKYYDKNGYIISKPISIPEVDNKNINIDAVSMEVDEQAPEGTEIRYYVAQDYNQPTSVSDFNWIPISPKNSLSQGNESIVTFSGTSTKRLSILTNASGENLELIPTNADSKNANEINPLTSLYSNKTVYRVARLNSEEEYITPTLYSGIDCFSHYYSLSSGNAAFYYKDLNYWSNQIQNSEVSLFTSTLKEQVGSIYPGTNSPTNGYIKTKINASNDININYTVSKASSDFNLAIYLNGINIVDLPIGTLNKSIEWNFTQGINEVIITYDKPNAGYISFSPMEGTSFSRYGTVFTDSFYYLDPFDFSVKTTEEDYYFTIESLYGSKEILSSRKIDSISNFNYISKNANSTKSIRFKAELNRFNNPFSSPSLHSVKLKFKHASD